jgi:hypothetical protein
MKRIRSVRIETVEDIEAIPEGEWVHVPAGIKAEWLEPDEDEADGGFEIRLPASVARRLRLRQGTKFYATLRGNRLLLKK